MRGPPGWNVTLVASTPRGSVATIAWAVMLHSFTRGPPASARRLPSPLKAACVVPGALIVPGYAWLANKLVNAAGVGAI